MMIIWGFFVVKNLGFLEQNVWVVFVEVWVDFLEVCSLHSR